MASSNVEDYLKTIYNLAADSEAASTSAIADALGVAAGSVTGMLKRLSDQIFILDDKCVHWVVSAGCGDSRRQTHQPERSADLNPRG